MTQSSVFFGVPLPSSRRIGNIILSYVGITASASYQRPGRGAPSSPPPLPRQTAPGATLDPGAQMTEALPDERPQRRREYSGPGSTLGLAALVIIVVGVAIWWFEFRDGGSTAGSGTPGLGIVELPEALNSTGRAPAAREGRSAPNFKLETPEGDVHTLDQYRGSYVLLNFWASWCGPCRGETPDLEDFHQATAHRDVVVIGVNQQEQAATARSFADEFHVTYPILLDSDGEVSNAYQFPGLPATFLIDPTGVVERVYYGRITLDQLAELEDSLP